NGKPKKLTEAQQKNDANLSDCITFRMNEINDTFENIKFQLKELRVLFEDSIKEDIQLLGSTSSEIRVKQVSYSCENKTSSMN
ncbi:16090_t:CDS:2, partial [Gigaspora rosea]